MHCIPLVFVNWRGMVETRYMSAMRELFWVKHNSGCLKALAIAHALDTPLVVINPKQLTHG